MVGCNGMAETEAAETSHAIGGDPAARPRQALLIVNARSGTADRGLEPALDRLRQGGIVATCIRPEHLSDIDSIIAQEAPAADLIILGGGDGTLSGSAAAVMQADRPLGILPMGTANDFARALAIPFDLEQAASVIVDGRRRHVDVGVLNGRPFLNVASIGLGADVARFHTGERKRRLKLLSYPLSWIDAYRRHRPFRARIDCDGDVRVRRCAQLAVGSGRHYGGGMTLSADAQVDDGWLRVYYVDPVGVWGWMRLLPILRLGRQRWEPNTDLLRARSVAIETRRAKPINVDGELIGQTPARFSILPRALEVIAPDGKAGGS